MATTPITVSQLRELALTALTNLGLKAHERQIVANVLLYAQLRDNSQGLIKIVEKSILPDANAGDIEIEEKSLCVTRINGNGNIGMLVLDTAAKRAIATVEQTGLALVATHNTRSSSGAIGYYARQLAKHGYIGIVLAGSPKVVAAYGGIDPVMGTNPIAIAIPTNQQPLVLDMATAAIAWFAVVDAKRNALSLPNDAALDHQGQPTTDPQHALVGALRTFGGAKGASLALMFEILTGPLTGAAIIGDKLDNRGNIVIAINPETLTSRSLFSQRVEQMISVIKSGRAGDIRLPGEASDARAANCLNSDLTHIDSQLLADLRAI